MHPRAIRYLVARIESTPVLAAVAGAAHVTNRDALICAMQVLDAAAIIGPIRRTQSSPAGSASSPECSPCSTAIACWLSAAITVRRAPRPLRRRARVGRGDLGRGDRPAHRRPRVALPLRPLGRARDAPRLPLPVAVPDRLGQRRGRPADHGADPRTAGTAGGVGDPRGRVPPPPAPP